MHTTFHLGLVTTATLCAIAAPAWAGEKDTAAVTGTIDRLLAARWTAAKAQPAAMADDAEFARRLYLDMAGRVPSVFEVRSFLADTRPDRRQRLVDTLINSPAYVENFTRVWRAVLLPEVSAEVLNGILKTNFETWLRVRLSENVGYDRMVREILTVPMNRNGNRDLANEQVQNQPGQPPSPRSFQVANENKPENLAGSTARLFLAVKLECAQCHNHPTAAWSREQFWEYAAFFAGNPKRDIKIPNLDTVVQAKFLDGSAPDFTNGSDPRVILADWMTKPANKYFARAAVNRVWAHFFGLGLVEPVDDLTQETEPNELLDDLARQFAEHGFDLKFLIRGVVNSKAYQLSSTTSHPSQDTPRLFARMAVKGMSPEQIYDSLAEATRFREPVVRNPNGGPVNGPRERFLARFANPTDKKTEHQTSILQALALMNGQLVEDATSLERSETLAAVADAPFLDTAGKVEALYLAALGRKPRDDESARCVKYVDDGGPTRESRRALADVFWALLNSSEFILNH